MQAGGDPVEVMVTARRYLCTACPCVMLVVPQEIRGRWHYSLGAMLQALAWWALEGRREDEVRARASPLRPGGFAEPRRWPTLRRWVRQRAELWPGVEARAGPTFRETAGTLVAALVARLHEAPALATAAHAFEAGRLCDGHSS